ncbi:MAG TPA: Spy/CpxP family protein refolding chaperone [Terriglobales bacterium]|nr:Spy/CpxP family protein refolding chaperone [Terriglobales bacterium]
MQKKTLIAVVLAVTVGAGALAARQIGMGSHGFGGMFARHLMNDLNLSDTQRSQIKQILLDERPTIQKLATSLRQQNQQMHSGDPAQFDEAAVRAAAQNESATITEAIVERERIRSRVFAVLTPDQRAKANQIIGEFQSHFADHLSHLGDNL